MMLLVLALALLGIAAACVTAVIGWRMVGQLQDELESVKERRSPTEVDFKMLAQKVAQLEIGAEHAAGVHGNGQVPAKIDAGLADRARQQAELLAGLRRWADGHFTAVAGDAAQSAQLVQELDRYAVRSLEHEVTSARAGSRILRCGLYSQQPSVLDVGPMLVGELRSALNADLMYRRADGPSGIKFYLRWPEREPSPRLKLESLLRAATNGVAGNEEPGTTQLHTILRALYPGGPAALLLGPLLLVRTETQMFARFVPTDWPGSKADPLAAAIAETPQLAAMADKDVLNLTGWSASQAA
jgi:hypothetical protein